MRNKKELLSVVIPVYNEEKTILTIVKRVLNSGVENLEIVVVDDFSQDKSRKILRKMKKLGWVNRLVLREKNGGKGAALRDGFAQVSGDIVIIQDADLEYDPQEYKKLMEPIVEGRADVVYGSRFIGSGAHRVVYYWHFLANSLLTTFSNIFTNLNLTDMETGYKVFKKEILDQIEIEENSFGIEPEVTAKIAKMKVRIYEVGISYNGRTYEEGKKIGLKDAFRAVWVILKFNLFR